MIRFLKNILRLVTWLILIIVLPVAGYLAAALIFSLLATKTPEFRCANKEDIFVFTNGVHTDIALSVNSIDLVLRKNLNIPDGTKYVSFGWGDKKFYINTPEWKDLTFKTAFRALFLKSESAMHVTFYDISYKDWKKINLCPEQLQLLFNYINGSFRKNNANELFPIEVKGYSINDRFYEALKSFSLFRTCNVWTNNALKVAEIKTSVWSPFDFGILYHLRPK